MYDEGKWRKDRHGVCCVLAKNIELALKVSLVERAILRSIPVTVVRAENDKRLQDERLFAAGSWTQDRSVSRNLSPAQDTNTELSGNF